MKYDVVVADEAASEAADVYAWIATDSIAHAEAWLEGFHAVVSSLGTYPRRCPLAPENDVVAGEIRHLLYGSYRVLFVVERARVVVLHVRHSARLPLEEL